MKNLFLFVVISAILAVNTSCNAQGITASEKYITKDVKVESFKKILVQSSPDVIYTQTDGGAPAIEIYTSDNIMPLLDVYVESNTLIIKFKKGTQIRKSGKVEVRVSAPAMETMEVSGSGDIHIPKGITTSKIQFNVRGSGDINGKNINCEDLNVSVNGSGDINLSNIKATTTNVKVSGSGDIKLSGTSVNANYSVSGSGDISASGLKADYVQANVSGSGDVTCHAVKTLKGGVRGSGDVGYKGNPEVSFSKKGLRKL